MSSNGGIRVVCPIGVHYPGSVAFTDLARTAKKDVTAKIVDSAGRYRNVLALDGLEYTEISCSGGIIRKMCTRVSLFVPWSPVLYVAIRPDRLMQLKEDINFTLCMNHRGNYNASVLLVECSSVRSLVRASDRVLWTMCDMTLYELRFDTFHARFVTLKFLKENAHARAHEYTLFATTDSTCFDVALASYFRKKRRHHHNIVRLTDAGHESGSDEVEGGITLSGRELNIDLHQVFEMGVWCRVNDGNVTTTRGESDQYICRLTQDEIARTQLPENPLDHLPVVSYDLETIARLDSTIPRGVETDQRLSSIALTIHCREDILAEQSSSSAAEKSRGRRSSAQAAAIEREKKSTETVTKEVITTVLVMAYVPLDSQTQTDIRAQQITREIQIQPDLERTSVVFFQDELHLLFNCLETLMTNAFFVDLFELDDVADAQRIACILVGYNCWEYDYAFLVNRAIFYGLNEHAMQLLLLHGEPRFCATQLSFDLMLHVRARYQAQIGSIALKHVSRFFGATDVTESSMSEHDRRVKMQFDAIAIRRLYFAKEKFDAKMAFEDLSVNSGVNMLRVLLYNVQDCTSVYYLMCNLCFLSTISLYSKHFYATFIEASHAGNSRLLPNAFAVHALREANVILPLRNNKFSSFSMPPAIIAPTNGNNIRVVCCGNNKSSGTDDHHRAMNTATSFVVNDRANVTPQNIVMPRTPAEMSLWYKGLRAAVATTSTKLPVTANSFFAPAYDQLRLMRIDDDKMYLGGINSATPNHYTRPICVDFTSFYPSIGCQYGLSMETVYVLTVDGLLCLYDRDETVLDQSLQLGRLRCFDYEPIDSPYRKSELIRKSTRNDLGGERSTSNATTDDEGDDEDEMRAYTIRGRDDLSAAVIRQNHGWYEGVEFANAREMIDSSADVTRRRILIVYRGAMADRPPIICSLWQHYLAMRKNYKKQIRELSEHDVFRRRVLGCMEKMFKVVANSLYGYLNYKRSIVYSPQVAAAVTLLSRKTFYETAWLCEVAFPIVVAQRDTLVAIIKDENAAATCGEDSSKQIVKSFHDKLIERTSNRYKRVLSTVYPIAESDAFSLAVAPAAATIATTSTVKDSATITAPVAAAISCRDGSFRRRVYRTISSEMLSRSFVNQTIVSNQLIQLLQSSLLSNEKTVQQSCRYDDEAIAVLKSSNTNIVPECEVVYRDTDGLMLFLRHQRVNNNCSGDKNTNGDTINTQQQVIEYRAITKTEQTIYENLMVHLVNGTFARYGYKLISLELEDSGVENCSIMGKKKYWKTLDAAKDRFVTKGFEKNAQIFVKHIVRVLQRNTAGILQRVHIDRCRLFISDFDAFFGGMFSALHNFYLAHGIDAFAFNLALNPRSVSGAEASFIQDTIERYSYNPGDRVRCVFLLGDVDPGATMFLLASEFSPNTHRLNYYKIIRRLAVYFVQLVEGFKRTSEKRDSPMYMSARRFDENLRRAYALWLRDTANGTKEAESAFARDPFFKMQSLDAWKHLVIPYLQLLTLP